MSAAPPPSTPRAAPLPRTAYGPNRRITTRWADNDVYGHVNNVVYYSWFDTAVNAALIDAGLLDIHQGSRIGLVVHTECHYFEPLAYPQDIDACIGVDRIGTTSVTYRVGLFAAGAELTAAHGRFTHVYVSREHRRPLPLDEQWIATLQRWA